MKQKCPECGRWCDGERKSFLNRCSESFEETANSFGELGAKIGGVFGKKGEKLGRMAGAAFSGATNVATVKGVICR